jgi:membrane associated rhomboid family serine protease
MTRSQVTVPNPIPGGPEIRLPFYHEPFTDALILNTQKVMQGEVWRLLTAGFLHSTKDIWHIVFNMLVLWFFGRQVEDDSGPREFLAFYLLAVVASSAVYVAGALLKLYVGAALGASGAVTAVLVVCALRHPRQVVYLFFVLPVPIWAFVVFMVGVDVLRLLGMIKSNIAASAHLGGAAFGAAYYLGGVRLTGWWEGVSAWHRRRAQPRLRIYREEPATPVAVAAPGHPDLDALRAELDAILEKISRVGQDQLTERERQVLQKASEVFKRRRG